VVTFFALFNVFLKSKKHDFLRFLRVCTRFLEHWYELSIWTEIDDTGWTYYLLMYAKICNLPACKLHMLWLIAWDLMKIGFHCQQQQEAQLITADKQRGIYASTPVFLDW